MWDSSELGPAERTPFARSQQPKLAGVENPFPHNTRRFFAAQVHNRNKTAGPWPRALGDYESHAPPSSSPDPGHGSSAGSTGRCASGSSSVAGNGLWSAAGEYGQVIMIGFGIIRKPVRHVPSLFQFAA